MFQSSCFSVFYRRNVHFQSVNIEPNRSEANIYREGDIPDHGKGSTIVCIRIVRFLDGYWSAKRFSHRLVELDSPQNHMSVSSEMCQNSNVFQACVCICIHCVKRIRLVCTNVRRRSEQLSAMYWCILQQLLGLVVGSGRM